MTLFYSKDEMTDRVTHVFMKASGSGEELFLSQILKVMQESNGGRLCVYPENPPEKGLGVIFNPGCGVQIGELDLRHLHCRDDGLDKAEQEGL